MLKTVGLPATERYRACPLCEAGCGLAFEVKDGRAVAVKPDAEDALSRGFICPKGVELLNLESDPSRLRGPVRRTPSGDFEPIGWDEALDLVATRLKAVQEEHGRDAVAVYTGTVIVHKYGPLLMRAGLMAALRTRNWSSASSQDTGARFASAHLMYGSTTSITVPDLDRTAYLLCIGANPAVSNGSLMTAPDARGRLRAIRQRGGKVVVIDPRRSETAGLASEHVSIRPGTDAALVLAMVQVLAAAGRIDRDRLAGVADGWAEVEARLARFTPALVERFTGVPAATIERLALEFADAPTSVAYSRMGPNNARHATLACHAIELLNLAAGRLGEVGGAMFPTPPIDVAGLARLTGTDTFGRHRSRVRGLPELIGELPATTLAEEMETPGPGQVKALLTYAGNPVLSVPNGRRLDRALAGLDFMAAIDIYVNETTRHADVILPPASCLAEDHLDLFFGNMRVENGVHWSRAIEQRGADERLDWEILSELTARLGGGPTAIRWVDAALRLFRVEVTPERIAGLALRMGPHGDHFLPWSKGLNRRRLQAAEHGVALGPLEPGFRHRVFHRRHRLQLAPPALLDAMDRLAQEIVDTPPDQIVLIGRRDLRSNNSWMHNVPRLVAGKDRCVLFIHPADAARIDAAEGERIVLESRVHRGEVTIHITDELREGVVSLPHGYGHRAIEAWQAVAGQHAGVSANDWVDDGDVEAIAGQSILNGVPVRLHRVS